MRSAKSLIIKAFHKLGYEIFHYDKNALGLDPFRDISRLVCRTPRVIVYDVGANLGQTTKQFNTLIPGCEIHSFEPSPQTFRYLVHNTSRLSDVNLNNKGVGSTDGEQTLLENVSPLMSSFLKPVKDWRIIRETRVEVISVDSYSEKKNIPYINVLKTDTQGFDLEVLKGANGLLMRNRIQLILTEITFSDMYQGMPRFDLILRFLMDMNFKLVSFYRLAYEGNMASWTDALFINPRFDFAIHPD